MSEQTILSATFSRIVGYMTAWLGGTSGGARVGIDNSGFDPGGPASTATDVQSAIASINGWAFSAVWTDDGDVVSVTGRTVSITGTGDSAAESDNILELNNGAEDVMLVRGDKYILFGANLAIQAGTTSQNPTLNSLGPNGLIIQKGGINVIRYETGTTHDMYFYGDKNALISQRINPIDIATKTLNIKGQSSWAGSTTNINGGNIAISGGTPVLTGSYGDILLAPDGGGVRMGSDVMLIRGDGAVFAYTLASSASYADDVAAAADGIAVGQLYRNGSQVNIRVS